jgi:DNA-binding MarR family transcriptional regulator
MKTLSAARTITRLYDEALRSTGLTITQFTLLIAIGKAKPTSISQIGKYLSLDRSSVTRNLKPLEAAGLVTRGPEGEKRMRQVLLTRAGKAKLKEAHPLWQRAQDAVEAALSDSSYSATMKGMTKLRSIDHLDRK